MSKERRLATCDGCQFSTVLLCRGFCFVVVIGFLLFGFTVAVGTLVLIGVAVAVRVLVFVGAAVGINIKVVMVFIVGIMGIVVVIVFMVLREAGPFLDLVEVLACSHGFLQTQSCNLLDNRLHDKFDAEFH